MTGAAVPEGARLVLLDGTGIDVTSTHEVAPQIPRADEGAPGDVIVLAASATRKRGPLGRLLGAGKVQVPLSCRCTALLARGYAELAVHGDVASGRVPADT